MALLISSLEKDLAEQAAAAPLWSACIGAASIVTLTIWTIHAMIGKGAPQKHKNGGSNDGGYDMYSRNSWFTINKEMKNAIDKKDSDKAENNSSKNAFWRTPTCNQFTQETNNGGNNKPHEDGTDIHESFSLKTRIG